MSYLPLDQMAFRDGPNLDSTGRLRISDSRAIICSSQEYNYHPQVWDHYTVSGGTATHATLTNSTVLRTGATTSGARALRQLKSYQRYVPGKSQRISCTGRLQAGALPTGTAVARIGYYDDNNGVFFYQNAAGLGVAQRSDVSGSVVTTLVPQASWNTDKLDGTGPSGATIDATKEQIYGIDLQWLGTGRVRFTVQINGVVTVVHQIVHANVASTVYMRTANLPIRTEVFNEGGAGSDIRCEAVCAALDSEGGIGVDPLFYPFAYSAYTGTPMSLDTTLRPVVTRRLRDTFNGVTVRGHANLIGFVLSATTNDVYWEIRYNTTIALGGGGSATVNNVDATYSISEFDTYAGAANTVSGGSVIMNGISKAGSGSKSEVSQVLGLSSAIMLGRTYAGVRDTYTLCAKALSGAASVALAVQIQEQY